MNGTDTYIVALGEAAIPAGLKIAGTLRRANVGGRVKADFSSRSLKAQMRTANKLGARHVLILGDNELANQVVVLRDMTDSSQEEVPLANIVEVLKAK